MFRRIAAKEGTHRTGRLRYTRYCEGDQNERTFECYSNSFNLSPVTELGRQVVHRERQWTLPLLFSPV